MAMVVHCIADSYKILISTLSKDNFFLNNIQIFIKLSLRKYKIVLRWIVIHFHKSKKIILLVGNVLLCIMCVVGMNMSLTTKNFEGGYFLLSWNSNKNQKQYIYCRNSSTFFRCGTKGLWKNVSQRIFTFWIGLFMLTCKLFTSLVSIVCVNQLDC